MKHLFLCLGEWWFDIDVVQEALKQSLPGSTLRALIAAELAAGVQAWVHDEDSDLLKRHGIDPGQLHSLDGIPGLLAEVTPQMASNTILGSCWNDWYWAEGAVNAFLVEEGDEPESPAKVVET